MSKPVKRKCPACGETKEFRADCKTCGCVKVKPSEQNEIKDDKWSITLPKTRIHTLDQLLDFFQVDLSVWEVEKFIANKWEMGSSTDDPQELYQVKAFLKKKVAVVAALKEIEELKILAKQSAKKPSPVRKPNKSSGKMLEINLADHHFGKLAWGAETGRPNYDVKIATDVFNRAFETLLERTAGHTFDEIWFIVGNDLLNSDDTSGRTTKGTYVATDIRYHKTFSVVRNVMVSSIERLRTLTKTVKVKMVSGNHDRLGVWHLGDSLECYFHKYSDVKIDNSPRYYKFDEFGQTMIMYSHGDKGKRKDYPLLMATEQREMFGRTKFHEAHTGHNHTDRVEEYHGVKVRTLSSLSTADSWHAENAYVGNLRSSEAFLYDRAEGLIGTVIYTDNDDLIVRASNTQSVGAID